MSNTEIKMKVDIVIKHGERLLFHSWLSVKIGGICLRWITWSLISN